MRIRSLKKVAVFEFINETPQGESLGTDYGLLGKYCAEALERELFRLRENSYSVVDQRRLQAALRDKQFTLDSLGSSEALKQLAESLDGLPAVVIGSVSGLDGRSIKVRCKLVETASGDLADRAEFNVTLDNSEWAMLGRSVAVKQGDRQKTASGEYVENASFIKTLDERSKVEHPLKDPTFPYRVRILIGNRERPLAIVGNQCYVPVQDGETYEIRVENRSGQKRLMRLLVDGLNTLPEKDYDSGVMKEVSARRMSLSNARSWVLDPASQPPGGYGIRGFVSSTGAEGSLDRFKIVSAEKSLAAQQQFTSDIGMITAAFYAPYEPPKIVRRSRDNTLGSSGPMTTGSPGPFGTGRGERTQERLETAQAKPGNLVAVVHIRYIDYPGFAKLKAAQAATQAVPPALGR